MKRTATLVAGLLLVTGTVFAAPTVTTTGEVVYKNTVFQTDMPVLQNDPSNVNAHNGDTQGLKAVVAAQFDAANKLELILDEGSDPATKLIFTNTGKETTFTAETHTNDGLFNKFFLTGVNTKGKVKAQVKGTLTTNLYGAAADGKGNFVANTDADEIYLQYAVTPSMTTTFYPYKTGFGVDSVFMNDEVIGDEFEGIKLASFNGNTDYEDLETVQELPGVKVEMTSGALKGLAVKVGSAQDNADSNGKNGDAKFAVDAAYSMAVAGVKVKADAAVSQDGQRNSKAALMVGASTKVANVDVQAELLNVMGNTASGDFTGIYAKATTKVAMVDVTAKLSNKKFGEKVAQTGLYVEGKYTAAEVAGVKPTITASYKMQDSFKDNKDTGAKISENTAKVVVDAAIVQDGITITPALELSKVTDTDATAKATIAVKYSF